MTYKNSDILFHLLRIAFGGSSEGFPEKVDWVGVMKLAEEQSVLSIAFDALERLSPSQRPDMDTLMDWLGRTSYSETVYEEHKEAIWQLAKTYSDAGIKMLLLKGYGLSLNYPTPSHRPTGDIDVYLCGEGKRADELIKGLGIDVKQNEDKHSTFPWMNTTVENHVCFISDIVHPCLQPIEEYLEKSAEYSVEEVIINMSGDSTKIFLPTANANAVFLPLHTAVHFFHGEASIRQLCDWATFVMKYHTYIGWTEIEALSKKAGYYSFLCCLNGIVVDYLGVPQEYLPKWKRNSKREKRVLQEILLPRTDNRISIAAKVIRFFKGYWKYRMVFNENIFLASIRQAKSYMLIKGHVEGKNIWELKQMNN